MMNVSPSGFFQARAHELEGVCVTEVWQDFLTSWKRKSNSVVGFRASSSRQTSFHNKP